MKPPRRLRHRTSMPVSRATDPAGPRCRGSGDRRVPAGHRRERADRRADATDIPRQQIAIGMLNDVQCGVFQDPTYWDLSNGKIKGAVNWAVAFNLASSDPLMQKVVADYKSFPEEPTIYSVYGYQALQAAVDAVKRACTATDREKFRDALADTKLEALGGSVAFR